MTSLIDNLALSRPSPRLGRRRDLVGAVELGDCSCMFTPSSYLYNFFSLNERNKARLEEALRDALEIIRIFDWEIDLKLRFGQIYLTTYKKPKQDAQCKHISIDQVADEFMNPRFASALAPCMAQKEENMKNFFAEIDSLGIRETEDSPINEYTIDAQITVEHPNPPADRLRNQPPPTITLNTRITCEFKEDGKVGLWRCAIDKADFFVASMFNAEKKYAWELKLSAAQRVEPELLSPVKAFVGGLRLPLIEDPELGKRYIHSKKKLQMGRLAYTKVPDVELKRICQKKIQRFDWEKEKNDFIIEVCRDEIWRIDSDSPTPISNVEIRLDNEPHAVMYKVSMRKQSWRTRFAENLRLSAGMAPTWSASDFLESEENEDQAENMTLLMDRAREMVDVLSKSLPRYWEWQET
ncbi:hypothetical protein BC936DRAFT_138024 [Jimgerdemannia flammicorona]|uniref:DUF7905 domain-containing protein n=1 Tax=Jimgerdemannia flammicorona TaxID=994334 RepID=A0A433DIR0_9FUNG|nr:hypothetical protein BC936DRAFT_138024 [Jimgerdemannia flammicorona]